MADSNQTDTGDERTPILRLGPGELPPSVLVVGDPKRAERVAEHFQDARELGHYREYLTIAGTFAGVPVAVSSHGVGGPGAAICFEELITSGATRLIRAGTCGALDPTISDGSLVVATAAVRNDGLSDHLVPMAYPAVSDLELTVGLSEAAQKYAGGGVARGIVTTEAAFYASALVESPLEMWRSAGVLAVEMECATLFVVAALRGVAAGAILTVDGHPLERNDSEYDPHRSVVDEGVNAMITSALAALTAGGGPADG